MPSKKEKILEWLKSKPITHVEALVSLRCGRLSARIHELREDGWPIVTTMIKGDEDTYYGEYTLDPDVSKWPT